MMRANNRLHYGPMVMFICLHITVPHYYHYYYYSDISEGMELLPVRYSLSSVYLRLSQLSQLSFMQYMGLCVSSLPISFVCDYENMCVLCNYHHQVWNIWHSLGLGHENWYALYAFLCFHNHYKKTTSQQRSYYVYTVCQCNSDVIIIHCTSWKYPCTTTDSPVSPMWSCVQWEYISLAPKSALQRLIYI